MPILDVELIGSVPASIRNDLACRIAEAAATVLESRPQGTWVKLHYVDEDSYAENAGGPPAGAQPVFVSVLEADPPTGERLEARVSKLTRAISDACGRPLENVHIIYEAPAAGRIAFGGQLRR